MCSARMTSKTCGRRVIGWWYNAWAVLYRGVPEEGCVRGEMGGYTGMGGGTEGAAEVVMEKRDNERKRF